MIQPAEVLAAGSRTPAPPGRSPGSTVARSPTDAIRMPCSFIFHVSMDAVIPPQAATASPATVADRFH
jgi:hypothetical protein